MSLILPRRKFLLGLGAALAAPAIVRFESLMPVKAILLQADTPISHGGLFYQWLINGVPIPGETGPAFQGTSMVSRELLAMAAGRAKLNVSFSHAPQPIEHWPPR